MADDNTAWLSPVASLQTILDVVPDAALAVDADGRIVASNSGLEQMFGYCNDEIVGRPVETLIPERFGRHREHRRRYLLDPRVRPMGMGLELYARRKDGSEFPVEISLSPLETDEGLLVSAAVRDITERKHASLAQARLAAIVDSSFVAIISCDTGGTITSWNGAAERLYGYAESEILGQHVSILIPPRRLPEEEHAFADALTGVVIEFRETERVRKDGALIEVSLSLSPIFDGEGGISGVSRIAHDIGERKRAEAALHDAFEQEKELTQRLRVADELKNALLQTVAHDVRNPVATILGMSEILRDDIATLSDGDTRHLLDRIAENARQIDRLAGGFLELDRLTSGRVQPDRRPSDIAKLVQKAARAAGLEGSVDIEDRDIVALVDPSHVERILENLIANAKRHTPPGTPIWLRISSQNGDAEVAVEDAGPGVPDEAKAAIFEPFVSGVGKPGSRGTGIGLSLVARFAELNGGRAWVEDRSGGGASFRVSLPLAKSAGAT